MVQLMQHDAASMVQHDAASTVQPMSTFELLPQDHSSRAARSSESPPRLSTTPTDPAHRLVHGRTIALASVRMKANDWVNGSPTDTHSEADRQR